METGGDYPRIAYLSCAASGWARLMWEGVPDTRSGEIEVFVFFDTTGVAGFAGTGVLVLGVGVDPSRGWRYNLGHDRPVLRASGYRAAGRPRARR
jgi:hypothetical protein